MSDVSNEILKNFSPAIQTTIRWVLLGVLITSGYFWMSSRVDAADQKATIAQAQVTAQQAKIDMIQGAVQAIQTQAAVTASKVDDIKASTTAADQKLDAILAQLRRQ